MPGQTLLAKGPAGLCYLACWALALSLGPTAQGADIFDLQGPYTKAHGGAGVIMSRGGAATLHNPANIWTNQQPDYYLDVSPSYLRFEFTPPDPDFPPGVLTIPVAPFMSFGGSIKSEASPVGFGAFFTPTGAGTITRLQDFPADFGGEFSLTDVESKQAGFKTGIAIAFRWNDNLSLGISALYDYNDNTNRVFLEGEEFVTIITRARSIRALLGIRYHWDRIGTFAASYQPEKKLHYGMRAKVLGTSTLQIFPKEFRPNVFGFGFHARRFAGLEPFIQYTHERWVSATFISQSPTQILAGDAPVEFLNTNNVVLGSRYQVGPGDLIGSFSMFQKNKGDGLSDDDGNILMHGRGAQDFEGLDRTHVTLGYELEREKSDWLFYGSYIQASSVSAEGTPSAGFYQLNIIMLGLGYVSKL